MSGQGTKELKAFREGKKLTLKQSVKANCADCMGNYANGKRDCDIPSCPLYPYMPYGQVWRHREKKIMSNFQANAMRLGLKRHKTEQR